MRIRVLKGKFVRIKREFLEEIFDNDTGGKHLRVKEGPIAYGLSNPCFHGYEDTVFQVRRDFYGVDLNGIGTEAIGVSFQDDFEIAHNRLPNTDDLYSSVGLDSSQFVGLSHRLILEGCPCGNGGSNNNVDDRSSWDARFFEVVKVKETIKIWEKE